MRLQNKFLKELVLPTEKHFDYSESSQVGDFLVFFIFEWLVKFADYFEKIKNNMFFDQIDYIPDGKMISFLVKAFEF